MTIKTDDFENGGGKKEEAEPNLATAKKTTAKKRAPRKKPAAKKATAKKSASTKAKETSKDAADIVASEGEVMFMATGSSWSTPSGVRFSREAPFQFVVGAEMASLLQESRFRMATKQEVKEFYNL